MNRFFLFMLICTLFFASCNSENNKTINGKYQVVKKYEYLIAIDISNALGEQKSKYVLNNLFINTYDSVRFTNPLTKPLVLYNISYRSKVDEVNPSIHKFVPNDTFEIAFSKNLCDTLFALTKDFFSSIEFGSYDTLGRLMPVIYDDSRANVELNCDGRKLNASISSIKNPDITTPQLDTLIRFVEKFKRPS
ncbi:hypothetical protein QTN47_15220 [Danxiaibacter flavus]|uniref:DUF4136 domain-containing protein n=1 Tax=Danxiaibacter flavus TaxID=3049108 RepID=A0ABV3ZG45_9BACT|nr:hypothetical protein QNM32_15230 [Chitinophagaceae bacterium DXS]